LIGREAELAEIARRLQDPACRLLTLVGPGGAGKTRLAQEAAADQLNRFEHGVCWVSLASLQSIQAIVPAVAQALDLFCYGQGEPRQQLLDYLREKSVLLVLDSFEHLLGGLSWVVDILETAPKVKTLITSRFRLNMQGAYLLPIAGLNCPALPHPVMTKPIANVPKEPVQLTRGASSASELLRDVGQASEGATQYSGIKLFLHGVYRVRPDFRATAGELADVAHICRLLQGVPLALLLAAAWAKMLTPAEILAHLSGDDGDSLDFLAADWPDVPSRQRSIRAVFDRSWNLLSEREREIFSALSVFRGGFTRWAAQQVSGASLRELMALVDKSLLQWAPEGRYEIHELLRRYAAEKLEQAPVASAKARDRYNVCYADPLHMWDTHPQRLR
jgi:predicted ATPase